MKAEILRGRQKRELTGVLLSFLALGLGLSLLTYSPHDPCLFIRAGEVRPVSNWMGSFGATLAGWLFTGLGLSGWIFPVLAAGRAIRFFRGQDEFIAPRRGFRLLLQAGGTVLLLISASLFFKLSLDRIVLDGEPVRAGGIIGQALGGWLVDRMGEIGALSLAALFTIVALMGAADFSPAAAVRAAAAAVAWLRDHLGEWVTRWWEARRRRRAVIQEREELEKSRTRREIKIVVEEKEKPRPAAREPDRPKQEKMPFLKDGEYELPRLDFLDDMSEGQRRMDQDGLVLNARILEAKLRDFGVSGEVVEVHPGPVITMYEYKPGPGIKINKIANLADDLAMALSAVSVRIIAPIPGKDVVGVEISNRDRETVHLKSIFESESFSRAKSGLPLALGKTITGEPFSFDLRKAPHLLVAGATGSGKSVSLNAMIMSVLFRSTPKEVQMVMIDPKRLELSVYEGIPHLLHRVIADPKDAALALKWAVAEMERRYAMLAEQGVRHIDSYNRLVQRAGKGKKKPGKEELAESDTIPLAKSPAAGNGEPTRPSPPTEFLPLILVIIDELADLMMIAARDIEESICRLAQMARAAGIHLILATQRPSVDVITGLIKANFPSRIAFKVASKTDSRTILDQNGAERLLGQGDMLFLAPGTSKLMRLHGAFVTDQEIKRVVEFWREQGEPSYDEAILRPRLEDKAGEPEEVDELYEQAVRLVAQTRQASVSMLQRKLKIGYNRAARIIERMEAEGLVGPSDGVKPREVMIDPYQVEQRAG